jgi:hypothetical protein
MRAQADHVEGASAAREMAPPRRPAPMPRQAIVFWTPRLLAKTMAGALKELGRLPRTTRPATISISKFDAPR